MARGLMTYPMGGTIDGVAGDHVLLAPPFIATESDLTFKPHLPIGCSSCQRFDSVPYSCLSSCSRCSAVLSTPG